MNADTSIGHFGHPLMNASHELRTGPERVIVGDDQKKLHTLPPSKLRTVTAVVGPGLGPIAEYIEDPINGEANLDVTFMAKASKLPSITFERMPS